MTKWNMVTVVTRPKSDDASTVEYLLQRTPFPEGMYQLETYTDGTDTWSVSAGLWSDEELAAVEDPDILTNLPKPDHVPEAAWPGLKVAAQNAQARFDLIDYAPDDNGNYPDLPKNKNRIAAIKHPDPHFVLSVLGLTRIPVDPE